MRLLLTVAFFLVRVYILGDIIQEIDYMNLGSIPEGYFGNNAPQHYVSAIDGIPPTQQPDKPGVLLQTLQKTQRFCC